MGSINDENPKMMARPAGTGEKLGEQSRLSPGEHFGRFQIISQLGEGGMGEVYLAHDSTLGRRIALKLLPSYLTNDIERVRRFEQEARSASMLNHPNILTIHEIGRVQGRQFIATEFVEAEDRHLNA